MLDSLKNLYCSTPLQNSDYRRTWDLVRTWSIQCCPVANGGSDRALAWTEFWPLIFCSKGYDSVPHCYLHSRVGSLFAGLSLKRPIDLGA